MCRVEANPVHYFRAAHRAHPVCAVQATPVCPSGGLNEHRLGEPPAVVGLVGVPAGSVPYATHLAIVSARGRAQARAIESALSVIAQARPDYGRLAAREAAHHHQSPEAQPVHRRPALAGHPAMQYTLPRRRWPIGGLVDLVI